MWEDVVLMIKFIIIGFILTIMYISYASLMKAAGKATPPMPYNNPNHHKDF